MAITLTLSPNLNQLSRNPVWAKLTTNNYVTTAGVKASLLITVSNTGATVGQTIILPFGDKTITLTFAASLDGTGNTIRTHGALSLANFILQLAADFATNYSLADAYDITSDSSHVILTAKATGTAYSFISPSETSTDIAIGTNTAGVDEVVRENFRIALDVYLEETYESGTYIKIHSQELIPINNICEFNIQSALHRYMGTDRPTNNLGSITLCTGILRRYKIRYAEKFGTNAVYQETTESSLCYVLKGGLSFIEYGVAPVFLTGYITSNQKFITWQPRTKTVVAAQQEFLYFLVPSSTTTVNLVAKIYYTDGSTSSSTILTKNPTVQNEIYILPTGYALLSPTAGKTVSKYQVWVTNQAAAVKSEVFTYKLSSKIEVDEHFFLFESSLGSWETLRTSGEQIVGSSVESSVAQRTLQNGYTNADGEIEKFDATGTNQFTQSTGFKTKADIDWLEDLLFSKKAIELINGIQVPILINIASITKYKSRDNLYAITFTYTHAFNNKAPKGLLPLS